MTPRWRPFYVQLTYARRGAYGSRLTLTWPQEARSMTTPSTLVDALSRERAVRAAALAAAGSPDEFETVLQWASRVHAMAHYIHDGKLLHLVRSSTDYRCGKADCWYAR